MKNLFLHFILFLNTCNAHEPISNEQPQTVKEQQQTTTPVKKADPKNYPRGYFRNPLDIPIQLSANFGELRPNHFHMGFDIRTNQRENLLVRAAAEGYISRVSIEEGGFGRAIYITHPNGYTTVYAHLNDFYPALHQYVINKQYNDEHWHQQITFLPGEFPVTKGQFIAYSGNTGSSAGPHLHFEIRDTETGNNLNPWLFNFNLPDNIPPSIFRLYYYDRRYSTYQVTPSPIAIKGAAGRYSANGVVILPTPTFSFGISAEDKNNSSPFLYGIYQAEFFWDDSLKSSFRLDDISYNETRYSNASIDYKTRFSGGPYIQHLGPLPANHSSIFDDIAGNGVINITDSVVHTARIIVKDASGNTSEITFKVRFDANKLEDRFFTQNSVNMPSGTENIFKEDEVEAVFSPRAFYDMVPFAYTAELPRDDRGVSKIHHLHNYKVPVHDSFAVRIKADKPITDDTKEKVVMQLVSNRKIVYTKGLWDNDWMEAKFRDLGAVRLLVDTMPPIINIAWKNGANLSKAKSMTVIARDNTELKGFKTFIDGKWLLFVPKGYSFVHKFDERTGPGTHQIKVTVTDIAGNVTEKNFSFTR